MRKARCCPAFNKKLIESGRAALYHSVCDIYWGIGIDTNQVEHPLRPENIAGENRHGKLLMEIRDTLLQGLQEKDSNTNVTSQVVWNTAVKQTLSLKETLQAPIREQVSHDQGDGIASRGNYVESRTDSALYMIIAQRHRERVADQPCKVEQQRPKAVIIEAGTKTVARDLHTETLTLTLNAMANENSETDSSRETSQEYDVTLDIINSKWPECKLSSVIVIMSILTKLVQVFMQHE